MTLSELISHVGDDNVQFQNLGDSLIEAKYSEKKGAWIKFATDPKTVMEMATGEPSFVGLAVWIPKDKLPDGL